MNFLTKTLLAGAALGALTTAPALAAPNIHLVGKVGVQLTATGLVHQKTNVRGIRTPNITVTTSIHGTFTSAAFYRKPTLLYAYDWTNGCTDTGTAESFKSKPAKTAVHKIKQGSLTGTRSASGCGSTIFTYYGPKYTRKVKGNTTDHFTGTLKATGSSSGTLTAHFKTTLKF